MYGQTLIPYLMFNNLNNSYLFFMVLNILLHFEVSAKIFYTYEKHSKNVPFYRHYFFHKSRG